MLLNMNKRDYVDKEVTTPSNSVISVTYPSTTVSLPLWSEAVTSISDSSSSFSSIISALMTSQTTSQEINMDKSNIKPVLIGNVSGANLLTVVNKQEPSQTSVSPASALDDQFINIMPVVIQQSDSYSLISKNFCSASTTTLVSSSCNTNPFQGMDKHGEQGQQSRSSDKPTARVLLINPDTDLCQRVPLSSSDTVILSTASVSTSNTFPVSSFSLVSNDIFLENLQTKDKSLVTSLNKPFSLLSNISDRSVSLESIPSLGLFQPDHDSVSNASLYKYGPVVINSSPDKITAEPTISDTICRPASSGMNVIGSKIPQSVILLLKQHLNQTSPCYKQVCSITSTDQNESNGPLSNNIQDAAVNDQNDNSNLSIKRQKDTEDEGNSDTDSEMQPEEVTLTIQKESDLSRSDTVILNVNKENNVICYTSPELHNSDTIVLAFDEKEVHSEERLSEGFSFASVNSSIPLEMQLSEPSVNKPIDIEVISNSLINQPLIPFSMTTLQNSQLNKSLYVVTNDGHLAAVGYISPGPLDITQLSQLGLINNLDASSLNMSHDSSGVSSRTVEAKETQTELIFGTNTLYFKLVDGVDNENIYANQHCCTATTNSLPTQPPSIPSTVVINHNALTPDEPQSLIENIQRTAISLGESAANEKEASRCLQPISQDTEYGITPLQTSEPELPDNSSGGHSAAFQCTECQKKFQLKQDLVSHEKVHKRGFKCDLCNATFTRIGNFNRHRKIHNLQPESQNTFKCNDCGREFLQRCDLKRHLLIHTKQEPYRCEQCGKGYIRRSDLVVHMRFHNKDKAFKCSMCDKKFFQTGDLSRHVRHAHIPNSQLTCGHCNRKYACESTLIRHMKAVHKDIILHTVNQQLQESESSSKDLSASTKDVLFTMTKSSGRKH